jgi:hypothetical protein
MTCHYVRLPGEPDAYRQARNDRDILGHVPRQCHPLVSGALKQVFARVDRDMASQVAARVIAQLRGVAPMVAGYGPSR